ncbi:MAG: multiheme c-type cytochrome [Caldilineaceae bacterium]
MMANRSRRIERGFGKPVALLAALVLALVIGSSAFAAGPAQGEQPPGSNDCVTCHATPGLQMDLPEGGVRSVYVSPQAYADSVHGDTLQCTACHEDIGPYPHLAPSWFRATDRDAGTLLRMAGTCGNCHEQQYRDYLGSNHADALAVGDAEVAVCSDCHTAHHIQPVDLVLDGMPLSLAVYACAECHTEQFEQYQASEHGQRWRRTIPTCRCASTVMVRTTWRILRCPASAAIRLTCAPPATPTSR